MIAPFEIVHRADDLADLVRRLERTRWDVSITTDWSYGTNRAFLEDIVAYWLKDYHWPERLDMLNHLPHLRAEVDGFGLHVLHYRSGRPDAVPLLLLNGWPSSFTEYRRIAPLLVDGDRCFDVVIPALPGFGYSDRPARPNQVEPWTLFAKLMTLLDYERFMVAGTDIGSGVATRIAHDHPERVLALHVSAVAPKAHPLDAPPKSEAEIAYDARVAMWMRDEGGYMALQSSKPQTLAFALADSPAGMASWILEKFRAWSDCGGDVLSVFSRAELIDNLMIYWLTNTIGSSMRRYFDAARLQPPLAADAYVGVPTGVAMWPHDIALAPRELAERLYNVRRYTVHPRGGHFPAWEVPELYADDLRQLAASSLK